MIKCLKATSNKIIFWGRGLPSSIALTQQVGKLSLLTKFIAAAFASKNCENRGENNNKPRFHYPTSFPGTSLLLRKDPGWGWSRVTQKFDRPRGSRQSIKLHASTFALYTSIARSECFVLLVYKLCLYRSTLRIVYTCQI